MRKNGKQKLQTDGVLLRTGDIGSEDNLRLVRCKSWFDHAGEVEMFHGGSDVDTVFILRWIALGCLYDMSNETLKTQSMKKSIKQLLKFANEMFAADTHKTIHTAVKQETQLMLRFVSSGYIEQLRHPEGRTNKEHKQENYEFKKQLLGQNLKAATRTILSRLHLIRNQVVHGKEIWGSEYNRQEIKDASAILKILVPVFANLIAKQN